MTKRQIKELGFKVVELNEAYQKVLFWFFSFPQREFSLSELSQDVGIAKTTASTIVTKLEEEGFLIKEMLGKVWRIKCNQQHPYNITKKIPYNLGNIYNSDIIEQIIKYLRDDLKQSPRAIVLFGSYRKGDDNEMSDIDIAVEILGNEDIQIKEFRIFPRLGYRKNVKVNLHIFSRNKIDLNLFSNIANGIVLYGFLEVRP